MNWILVDIDKVSILGGETKHGKQKRIDTLLW